MAAISRLDGLGIPVIVRTPLIPGVTDEDENLLSIAGFLSKLKNVLYYELLNFNPLGGSKYKALDIVYEYEKTKPLSDKRLEEISRLLADFKVKIS